MEARLLLRLREGAWRRRRPRVSVEAARRRRRGRRAGGGVGARGTRGARGAAAAEAAEAEVNAKLRELEEALKSTREEAARAEADAHAARIAALAPEVAAFHSALSADVALKRTSHATRRLSAAVLSVEEALDGAGAGAAAALGARWRRLPALAATLDDALLAEVLAAPAPRASADEITLPALSARYDAVATSARVAALTPEHSGLWGHILGAVVARLTVSADGRGDRGAPPPSRARARGSTAARSGRRSPRCARCAAARRRRAPDGSRRRRSGCCSSRRSPSRRRRRPSPSTHSTIAKYFALSFFGALRVGEAVEFRLVPFLDGRTRELVLLPRHLERRRRLAVLDEEDAGHAAARRHERVGDRRPSCPPPRALHPKAQSASEESAKAAARNVLYAALAATGWRPTKTSARFALANGGCCRSATALSSTSLKRLVRFRYSTMPSASRLPS